MEQIKEFIIKYKVALIIGGIVLAFVLYPSINSMLRGFPKAVNNGDIVYYTPNGKSYHSTKECPTLARSSNILSGVLNTSTRKPRVDACDNCVKLWTILYNSDNIYKT